MSRSRKADEGPAALEEWGRRRVDDSTEVPRAALGFLETTIRRRRGPPQGATPGAMVIPEDAPEPIVRIMRYGPDTLSELQVRDPSELDAALAGDGVAWIDVEGFGSRPLLSSLAEKLEIHPLAMADVVHAPQRPKAELHDQRLLVVTQMARVGDTGGIDLEQVSLVLGPDWVISFKERPGDVFDPVRERIRSGASRFRRYGPDYLLYSLIDAVVDGYFPVVEALEGVLEALEEEVIHQATPSSLARIHATRRTLQTLHRVQWRQRDAVNAMLRDEDLPISDAVKPYLRDVHDHAFQILDILETHREIVIGLMDLNLSSASHRLNEVMKTLTIVATIFIPLTFMSGVYGMNFDHMPELHWKWGYPAFWIAMAVLGVGLVAWFRRRGWVGGDGR